MITTKRSMLFFALLLSGLEEVATSQRGHCVLAERSSICSFEVLIDFQVARETCQMSNGELFASSSEEDVKKIRSLLSGFSGRYWLHNRKKLQNCPAVSVTREQNVTLLSEACGDKLDGFVCQYKSDEVCSHIGGEELTHVTFQGFNIADSETFPPGTSIAVGKVGDKYPDSKHLCFSKEWLQAPWSCEVLKGGCEHNCSRTTNTCICPVGQTIHPNTISCIANPCAACTQGCQQEGGNFVCKCNDGYRLAPDGKNCVDVDECKENLDACTAEGEECTNKPGKYECSCADGFTEEDGVCVNVTICVHCEHMKCQKIIGVYQCVCREGFRVSPKDPTRCEQHCPDRHCPAICVPNPDLKKKDMQHCNCPDGFVVERRNETAICYDINECEQEKMCHHKCENLFGSYRCLCKEGFELKDQENCVKLEKQDENDGSGSTPPDLTPASTPASSQPAYLPFYIKTGSILGITVFLLLSVMILTCLARNIVKRCSKFEVSSLKHPDMDIFYLQQVTTETYKRLSFDKQFKNNSQRL